MVLVQNGKIVQNAKIVQNLNARNGNIKDMVLVQNKGFLKGPNNNANNNDNDK